MKSLSFLLPLAVSLSTALAGSEWNQWRGPNRNGILPQSQPLLNTFPAEGLKELWDSEAIPSNDDGGLGSVVVSGGRAYLSVVWHSDVPSETRTINDLVMRQLGYQSTAGLSKELVAKMEADRESLSPSLRGKKLDEWVAKWVEDNLDKKQRALNSGFIGGRFRKGKLAIPLNHLDTLQAMVDKPFATDADFHKWLDEQQFPDFVKAEVIAAVPPTRRVADDAVICLDLATGKTIWKAKVPGEPKGRNCSSTPAVVDGKVVAMGSTQILCVDAKDGATLWSAPLLTKAPGSSPLVIDGLAVINAGKLAAYDLATGKKVWQQDKAGGANSSPVLWENGGRMFVVCNGRDLTAVDLKTGALAWTAPAGGDSTPAIVGDTLAVQSRVPKLGLVAYRISATSAEKLWNIPIDAVRTQSSPIIHDGHVFLVDDNIEYSVNLATGKVAWQVSVPTTISSPVLADGKLFVMINGGNNLQVLKATGAERVELGKANVRSTWVPSPAIADGKLILRMKDRVRCFNLAEVPARATN